MVVTGRQIHFVRARLRPTGSGHPVGDDCRRIRPPTAPRHRGHVLRMVSDETRITVGMRVDGEIHIGILDIESGAVTDLGSGYAPNSSPDGTHLPVSHREESIDIIDLSDRSRTTLFEGPAHQHGHRTDDRSCSWADRWTLSVNVMNRRPGHRHDPVWALFLAPRAQIACQVLRGPLQYRSLSTAPTLKTVELIVC